MRDCDVAVEVSARRTTPVLQPARPRPRAATSVLSGTIPDPLLSSRARGWDGLTVELQSFHDLDVVVQSSDHVIAVQLAGSVSR